MRQDFSCKIIFRYFLNVPECKYVSVSEMFEHRKEEGAQNQ